MFHLVAHTVPGRRLFHDVEGAARLWHRLAARLTGWRAACLMPDHVHVLFDDPATDALASVLSGHARWLNHRGQGRGALIKPSPEPDAIASDTKLRRSIRYVHLNPCRAGLVDDPLAWPFSTHLDAVGLTPMPVRRVEPDPRRFHAYVSGDPTVDVAGSPLPEPPAGRLPIERVLAAVSVATRLPVDQVCARRGSTRSLLIASARGLSTACNAEIARLAGVDERTVRRTPPVRPHAIARLAGDSRILALDEAWGRGRSRW